MSQPTPAARPRLSPGVRFRKDGITGDHVLLFPEGVVRLNATGAAILELCDGVRSIDDVVLTLATRFDTSPEKLRDDVSDYLSQLAHKGHVRFEENAT